MQGEGGQGMRRMWRGARVAEIAGTAALVAGFGVSSAWAAEPVGGLGSGGAYFAAASGGPGMAAKSQGYLGVDIRDVGDDRIAALKLPESRGAEVIHVDHDGPAGKAGLREHDVILQMNGQVIEGEDQLRRMLRETPAGRTATMVISRDGQQQTMTTQLANRLEVEREAWEHRWQVPVPTDEGMGSAGQVASGGRVPGGQGSGGSGTGGPGPGNGGASSKGQSFFSPGAIARGGHNLMGSLSMGSSYTGAAVETMGPQLAEFFGTTDCGVLVHSVDPRSPAADAGFRAGDVVVRANEQRMTSSSEWMKMVRGNRGKSMRVVVMREKKEQTLILIPDGKKRSSVDVPDEFGVGRSDVVVASREAFSLR